MVYVITTTGTQRGAMGELPASGKELTLTTIIIRRFVDGKIAETCVSWDNVAMLTQLCLFTPSAQNEP